MKLGLTIFLVLRKSAGNILPSTDASCTSTWPRSGFFSWVFIVFSYTCFRIMIWEHALIPRIDRLRKPVLFNFQCSDFRLVRIRCMKLRKSFVWFIQCERIDCQLYAKWCILQDLHHLQHLTMNILALLRYIFLKTNTITPQQCTSVVYKWTESLFQDYKAWKIHFVNPSTVTNRV